MSRKSFSELSVRTLLKIIPLRNEELADLFQVSVRSITSARSGKSGIPRSAITTAKELDKAFREARAMAASETSVPANEKQRDRSIREMESRWSAKTEELIEARRDLDKMVRHHPRNLETWRTLSAMKCKLTDEWGQQFWKVQHPLALGRARALVLQTDAEQQWKLTIRIATLEAETTMLKKAIVGLGKDRFPEM